MWKYKLRRVALQSDVTIVDSYLFVQSVLKAEGFKACVLIINILLIQIGGGGPRITRL